MIAVVGAGMGGLAAAARLAKKGRSVTVFESRPQSGGLASGVDASGTFFDGGPYLLLDRPGLEWVFHELGEELSAHVSLRSVDEVYEVQRDDGPAVFIYGDLDRTADGLEKTWPGSGPKYRKLVDEMSALHERLRPLLVQSRPGLGSLLRTGAWRAIPFLLRSLDGVLDRSGLPREVADALAIWTHVAGQRREEAPSPMAFVPALIHRHQTWYPSGGMRAVPQALEKIARAAGAEFRFGARVRRIRSDLRLELEGETVQTEAVVSNAGLGTYLELLEGVPGNLAGELRRLPLQAPGVCAYLAAEGDPSPPYLKFRLPKEGRCRLLIQTGLVDPNAAGTLRLMGPVDFDWAEREGPEGQRAYLDRILEEPWWRTPFRSIRTLASRIPADWGREFGFYRNAMNPVMTARFMRRGRLAHRCPFRPGLFLAGSATHPGQWVSFSAISGILAAKELAC